VCGSGRNALQWHSAASPVTPPGQFSPCALGPLWPEIRLYAIPFYAAIWLQIYMQLYGCANAGGIFFGILCCVGEVLECCFPYKSLHIQPSKSHSLANQGSDNYLCTAMIRYVLLVVFSFLV